MRKLRVGVWLEAGYKPDVGGGFGYYTEMFSQFATYQFDDAEITFIHDNNNITDTYLGKAKVIKINWRPSKHNFYYRLVRFISKKIFGNRLLKDFIKEKEENEKQLLYDELYSYCDIVYYIVPGCKYPSFPYVYTLWDIGHLSSFSFPELVNNQNFEIRKNHHDYLPNKALMIFCESESGKNDAIRYLAINPEKIRVLPLFPSGVIKDEIVPKMPNELSQNNKFLFYPAQYWAHKNHFGLLNAFKIVLEEFSDLKLVLTGSDKGNYKYIQDAIVELGILNSVIDLGFVTIEEMKWLYKNSCGLVMPTLLGPSNMPPLEALYLGCPVAISDFPGHRESLGDSAIYFNPMDFKQMANSIKELINNPPEINVKKRIIEDNMSLLNKYFNELRQIRFTWGKE